MPQTDLATGVGRYLEWIRTQADVKDYFSEAADLLRSKGIVHKVAAWVSEAWAVPAAHEEWAS